MTSKTGFPWQHVIPLTQNFPESCSPINFSKSGYIWLVLFKYQGSSRKLNSAEALSATPPPPRPNRVKQFCIHKLFKCSREKRKFINCFKHQVQNLDSVANFSVKEFTITRALIVVVVRKA